MRAELKKDEDKRQMNNREEWKSLIKEIEVLRET